MSAAISRLFSARKIPHIAFAHAGYKFSDAAIFRIAASPFARLCH
jgi:hypothetical protein